MVFAACQELLDLHSAPQDSMLADTGQSGTKAKIERLPLQAISIQERVAAQIEVCWLVRGSFLLRSHK